jgi:hypothetical protein
MIRALAISALALAAVAMSLFSAACYPISAPTTPLRAFKSCEGRYYSSIHGVGGAYRPARADSCKQSLEPFDMGAWIEAPLNSHKTKGLRTIVMGCSNLTPSAEDCDYGGILGHSVTLTMNFDMAVYPENARVQKAVLAVRVRDNINFFAQTAQLRGRQLIGDTFQSLGGDVVQPATQPGWVQFDITSFAARAINERRNSVSFELSLPCGRSESELVTVSVMESQPVVVVEFK